MEWRDLRLYVEGMKEGVACPALLLAATSPLLASLLREQWICDGCQGERSVILAGEEGDTVRGMVRILECPGVVEDPPNTAQIEQLMLRLGLLTDPVLDVPDSANIESKVEQKDQNVIISEVVACPRPPSDYSLHSNVLTKEDQKGLRVTTEVSPEPKSHQDNQTARPRKPRLVKATTSYAEYEIPGVKHKPKAKRLKKHKSYKCALCGWKCRRRAVMYEHYSLSHYQDSLTDLVGEGEPACPVCGKVLAPGHGRMIAHIGAVHDLVENFLPRRLHLPRALGLWKGKRSKQCPRNQEIDCQIQETVTDLGPPASTGKVETQGSTNPKDKTPTHKNEIGLQRFSTEITGSNNHGSNEVTQKGKITRIVLTKPIVSALKKSRKLPPENMQTEYVDIDKNANVYLSPPHEGHHDILLNQISSESEEEEVTNSSTKTDSDVSDEDGNKHFFTNDKHHSGEESCALQSTFERVVQDQFSLPEGKDEACNLPESKLPAITCTKTVDVRAILDTDSEDE